MPVKETRTTLSTTANRLAAASTTGNPPTEEQLCIAECPHRFVQVQAFAGTGKSTVIALCVERDIANGVLPTGILALSFSNSARDTLRQRLPVGVEIRTIHSFSKEVAQRAGLRSRLLTEKESLHLLKTASKDVRKQLKLTGRHAEFLKDVGRTTGNLRFTQAFFDLVRAGGQRPSDIIQSRPSLSVFRGFSSLLKEVFRRYERLKEKAGRMDYADMVLMGTKALGHGQRIGYSHVYVDEYQDCTPALSRFVAALALQSKRLRVLGDRFQGIFGFAGAQATDLKDLLPNVVELPLTVSFRLTKQNAALASAVIAQSTQGLPPIVGGGGDGPRPQLIKCHRAHEQDHAVLSLVRQLQAQGADLGKIAVLAYTKAQLRGIEQELLAADIETQPLYRKRLDTEVYAVLELVRRLEKLGTLSGKELRGELRRRLRQLAEGLDVPESTRERHRRLLESSRLSSLQSRFKICASAYIAMRQLEKSKDDKDEIAAIRRWEAKASEFTSAKEMKSYLKATLNSTRVVTNTIHQAKGGEWDHVIVLNVVEGCIPFFRDGTGTIALEQGRNLFYVATTRARRSTTLIQAPYSNARARPTFKEACPYIRDRLTRKHLDVSRFATV